MIRRMCFGISLKLALGWLLILASAYCRADLVVVVNAQSNVEQLTRGQVVNIFLGSNRELPGGIASRPVDMPTGSQEKAQFYRVLVNKSIDQMAAYWSRLVFAGNTSPPVQAASVQEVLQYVAANRGAIGYVDQKNVDARVKVVLTLPNLP